MRARAAESLCTVCLSMGRERGHAHNRDVSETLTDRENAGATSMRKSKGVCDDCLAEMSAVSQEGKERL